jgi:hypothetical protein
MSQRTSRSAAQGGVRPADVPPRRRRSTTRGADPAVRRPPLRSQRGLAAVNPDPQCAGQHVEAFLLVRMDMVSGDRPAGLDVHVALQEFAVRLAGYSSPHDPLAGDRVLENIAGSGHDPPVCPKRQELNSSPIDPAPKGHAAPCTHRRTGAITSRDDPTSGRSRGTPRSFKPAEWQECRLIPVNGQRPQVGGFVYLSAVDERIVVGGCRV